MTKITAWYALFFLAFTGDIKRSANNSCTQTRPHKDALVPQLQASILQNSLVIHGTFTDHKHVQDAWQECLKTFGRENVVIVSNATGTRSDPVGLEVRTILLSLDSWKLMHVSIIGRVCFLPSRSYCSCSHYEETWVLVNNSRLLRTSTSRAHCRFTSTCSRYAF